MAAVASSCTVAWPAQFELNKSLRLRVQVVSHYTRYSRYLGPLGPVKMSQGHIGLQARREPREHGEHKMTGGLAFRDYISIALRNFHGKDGQGLLSPLRRYNMGYMGLS